MRFFFSLVESATTGPLMSWNGLRSITTFTLMHLPGTLPNRMGRGLTIPVQYVFLTSAHVVHLTLHFPKHECCNLLHLPQLGCCTLQRFGSIGEQPEIDGGRHMMSVHQKVHVKCCEKFPKCIWRWTTPQKGKDKIQCHVCKCQQSYIPNVNHV